MTYMFFALVSVIAAMTAAAMGVLVLWRNPKGTLNRLFMVLCLQVGYWAFVESQVTQASSAPAASFWAKAAFAWPLTPVVLLHFALLFTGHHNVLKSRLVYVVLYGSAAALSIVDLMTNWITGPPIKEYWGWTFSYAGTPIAGTAYLFIGLLAIASVLLCARFYLELTDPRRKREAGLVLIGLSVPVIVGVPTDLVLPALKLHVPGLGALSSTLGVVTIIGYAMWRYELFALASPFAADKILSTMSDSLLLTDPAGAILTINRAASELLGYEEDELIGRPIADVAAVSTSMEPSACDIETVLTTKQAQGIPASVSWADLQDSRGDTHGVVWIARDTSERKRSQDALRTSEDRYRRLVEAAPDGIGVAADGLIVYLNAAAAKLYGASSPDGLIGKPVLDFVHPDFRDTVAEAMRRFLEEGEDPGPVELRLLRADGTYYDAEITPIPFMHEGRPAIQIVFRDITMRKQIDQLRADVAAMVSHELRSPLSVVIGNASLIEKLADGSTDDAVLGAARKIRERADYMTHIARRMLDLSQIEAGTFALTLEDTDVVDLVRRAAELVPAGERHDVAVTADADLAPIECDRERLAMAVTNLVSNAVKYSPDGGPVRVAVVREEDRVLISVKDHGVGIPPEDLLRVFERFDRGNGTKTVAFDGTGIGLYLTRKIVDAHGGRIDVTSFPDKGSVFTIALPVRQSEI